MTKVVKDILLNGSSLIQVIGYEFEVFINKKEVTPPSCIAFSFFTYLFRSHIKYTTSVIKKIPESYSGISLMKKQHSPH